MVDKTKPVLRQDPVIAEPIEKHDPYVETDWDKLERLCISIINQQLTTASANAVQENIRADIFYEKFSMYYLPLQGFKKSYFTYFSLR